MIAEEVAEQIEELRALERSKKIAVLTTKIDGEGAKKALAKLRIANRQL